MHYTFHFLEFAKTTNLLVKIVLLLYCRNTEGTVVVATRYKPGTGVLSLKIKIGPAFASFSCVVRIFHGFIMVSTLNSDVNIIWYKVRSRRVARNISFYFSPVPTRDSKCQTALTNGFIVTVRNEYEFVFNSVLFRERTDGEDAEYAW